MDFESILRSHAVTYPLMEPCDAVKLVYQATFGGGHMIRDEESAHACLLAEYASIPHTDMPLRVEVLGDTARIYLDGSLSESELSLISQIFCASARLRCRHGYAQADAAARLRFDYRLALLAELCREGAFAFTPRELKSYIAEYRAADCPVVSHSGAYRSAYTPAYRVIDSRYIRLIPCILRLAELLKRSERVVLAIDGRCASGKSTAAELLCEIFAAQVIHMDDFFLPSELRTHERLFEVGGNLHRERFIAEVLPKLRSAEAFSYRVFDCAAFAYADKPRLISPSPLIICEGSYALHPDFGEYYDLAVFSDVDPDEQLRRIRERCGERMFQRFRSEWIPMEELYFDTFAIRPKCALTLSPTELYNIKFGSTQ